ncbi:MAG: ABC transporter substrate-binding protein [Proteobacteria bacterium]|nr:ABC transporter substrate-binding protein [Desulfocapsa sp.]MBU3943640.1 ABC transporter substrate-binding protein [Pseudomonadota bacterium]MCG2743057.1 ABC transporter substrate-binding protein [Desulfobacteraceae bacterium]MBU3982033.1 ABC transporter substrate-binding protein [Pseudomonadota bacterium]MBU4028694.1 ABC transporter substrate-binding protein [Pseudomonadota bacterium]
MHKILIVLGLLSAILSSSISMVWADDEVKIAAIFAKSGEAAEDNLEFFEAARFAVDEVNSAGGVHGRKIKLVEYDNHSTPIQSKLAAKKAVADGAVAVIGASWSSHSLAMAPYLQKMKVPMISPNSTHPDVTLTGDFIFRACFNDNFQGKTLAKFARENLKAATAVVVMNISSDYGIGLSKIFKEHFTVTGGKVLAILNYKSEQTDFKDLLQEVKALNPDVLFIPGYAESGYVVRQAQDMGITAMMLGGDGWPDRQFYANGGQDLKEGYFTVHWSEDLDTDKSREFVARYKRGYEIPDFATIAYDASMLLFDAMKRAESLDSQSIRDALAATENFDGVTGKISFDENGDPVKQALVMKITNGRPALFMIIKPN